MTDNIYNSIDEGREVRGVCQKPMIRSRHEGLLFKPNENGTRSWWRLKRWRFEPLPVVENLAVFDFSLVLLMGLF